MMNLSGRNRSILLLACLLFCLFFFCCIELMLTSVPVSAHSYNGVAVLDTPTVTDPTVTALQKEQLVQQVEQLKNENAWYWTNASTFFTAMTLIIAGIAGGIRWFGDRQAEREKRTEERFQTVVTGLGADTMQARAGAAIMLHTFLQDGYERFYLQAYELAIVHLRQVDPPGKDPIPSTPLRDALTTIFKEAYPLARKVVKQDSRYFNASRVQLDFAYLSGSDLHGIWMPNSTVRQAFLNRINLADAILSDCKFAHSELKNANLANAQLRRVDFSHADLSDANLSHTKLRRAMLIDANMKNADFTGAELPQADLTGADLTGSNIEAAASLSGTVLTHVQGLKPEQRDACLKKGAQLDEDKQPLTPATP